MNEQPRKLSRPISAVLTFIAGMMAFLSPFAVKAAIDYEYSGAEVKANVTFVCLVITWIALRRFTLAVLAMLFWSAVTFWFMDGYYGSHFTDSLPNERELVLYYSPRLLLASTVAALMGIGVLIHIAVKKTDDDSAYPSWL